MEWLVFDYVSLEQKQLFRIYPKGKILALGMEELPWCLGGNMSDKNTQKVKYEKTKYLHSVKLNAFLSTKSID